MVGFGEEPIPPHVGETSPAEDASPAEPENKEFTSFDRARALELAAESYGFPPPNLDAALAESSLAAAHQKEESELPRRTLVRLMVESYGNDEGLYFEAKKELFDTIERIMDEVNLGRNPGILVGVELYRAAVYIDCGIIEGARVALESAWNTLYQSDQVEMIEHLRTIWPAELIGEMGEIPPDPEYH